MVDVSSIQLSAHDKSMVKFTMIVEKLCYNIDMIKLVFRLAATVISITIIILGYCIISWNIFGKPTFLSSGTDCTPSTNIKNGLDLIEEKSAAAKPFFRDGSMFGNYCATH